MCIRQCSVTEFLKVEVEKPICIHEKLKNGYSYAIVDVSTVRQWIHYSMKNEGQTPLVNEKQRARTAIAVTPRNIQQVDESVHDDSQLTTN